jgi:hypothetical protein
MATRRRDPGIAKNKLRKFWPVCHADFALHTESTIEDPCMTSATSSEKSIFLKAIELTSDEERARYLDTACGGNRSLRAEIEALLRAH